MLLRATVVAQDDTSTERSPPDHANSPRGVARDSSGEAAPGARLGAAHREAARQLCACATRLTELWQESTSRRSAASPGLLDACLRLQLDEELAQLQRVIRALVAQEESALRDAGIRRFPGAWRDHKRSHARLLARIERRARHGSREPPGALARNVARLLEDYWAAHFPDHDQLALSLLALLERTDDTGGAKPVGADPPPCPD
ncbi:MAG: hypothetical protein KDG52_08270 [Rhodocyclaceae bacterium]|nr:hypothetical protein [Rhodocyclaceae bacterium]